jgi:hypothetical protein
MRAQRAMLSKISKFSFPNVIFFSELKVRLEKKRIKSNLASERAVLIANGHVCVRFCSMFDSQLTADGCIQLFYHQSHRAGLLMHLPIITYSSARLNR